MKKIYLRILSGYLSVIILSFISIPKANAQSCASDVLGNDTSLCVGQCITLSIGVSPPYILWSTGDTLPTIEYCSGESDTIIFVAYGTGPNDCGGGGMGGFKYTKFDTISISRVSSTAPERLDTANLSACTGDCINMQGFNLSGSASFSWEPSIGVSDTAISAPQICVNFTNNNYTATVTLENTCVYTFDYNIKTTTKLLTTLPITDSTVCEGACLSLSGPPDGTYYRWTPNTFLNNDTSLNVEACPTSDISYVVYSRKNADVVCENIDTINLKTKECTTNTYSQLDESKIVISDNILFLNLINDKDAVLTIYNMNGQMIAQLNSNKKSRINLNNHIPTNGIYILNVRQYDKSITNKFNFVK